MTEPQLLWLIENCDHVSLSGTNKEFEGMQIDTFGDWGLAGLYDELDPVPDQADKVLRIEHEATEDQHYFLLSELTKPDAWNDDKCMLTVKDLDGELCEIQFMKARALKTLDADMGDVLGEFSVDDQLLKNGVWFVKQFDKLHHMLGLDIVGAYQSRIEQVLAEVERLTTKAKPPKPLLTIVECGRCGSMTDGNGLCTDETCPFDSHQQDCEAGWTGHPEKDPYFMMDDKPIPCTCKKNERRH